MDKNMLRRIRRLDATKQMVEKAKAEYGYKEVQTDRYLGDGKWGTAVIKYKYEWYMRCQIHNEILKCALYDRNELAKGIVTAKYEIFINPQGNEYITRILENGEEVGWSKAMIYNLPSNFWYEKAWLNQSAKNEIRNLLNVIDTGIAGIYTWQKGVKTAQRLEAEKRQTTAWDKMLEVIPKEPKDWLAWCKSAIESTFMFYKAGSKEVYCSMCGNTFVMNKRKSHTIRTCPCCGRRGTVYSTGKIPRYIKTQTYKAQLCQKIKDGYCIREYRLHMSIQSKDYFNSHVVVEEYRRVIYLGGKRQVFNYEMYKNKYMRWCHVTNDTGAYYMRGSAKLYMRTLPALERTYLKESGAILMARHFNKDPIFDIEDYIVIEQKNRWLEKLVKAGFYNLAIEMLRRYEKDKYVDSTQSELIKLLKIDKEKLARLRKNENIACLEYLQLEKTKGIHIDDEVIRGLSAAKISPGDIKFISDKMSIKKIYNYLVRQSNGYKSLENVLREWHDYYNMAGKAKMQLSSEQIYKPANLSKAHADVIYLLQKGDIEKKAKEIAKKYKNVEAHCKELVKYEYSDNDFTIIAPAGIVDIFKEGMALRHCIHTCDFYWDRINRRESYLLFLRRTSDKESHWYTLEVEPSGNIRQKRTVGDNQNKDFDEAIPFLKKWQQEIKKRLTKEDKELGAASEELRKKNYAELRKNKNVIWHGVLKGKLLADVLENDFMGAE